MLRKITGILLVIFVFLIQSCFGSVISIAEITPNLMIILVVSWGFLNGRKNGLLIGFFGGLIIDIFYGPEGIIGLTALIYMFVGLLNGMLHEIFYGEDIKFPIALVAVSDFIYNFIFYVIMFLLRNRLDIGFYMGRIIIPSVIYTTIVAIFVYKILFAICKKIDNIEKEKEGKHA